MTCARTGSPSPRSARRTPPASRRPRSAPLADPVWGYDVFRPYALKPAPCQTTCSGAVDADGKPISLMAYYDMLAAANPTLVKREVYGKSLLGTDLVAYKVTDNARSERDGDKPASLRRDPTRP